tara:strand:- start:4086 stop:4766 length:681 start_codon:yes stop_codon:yes gene_type:complete
MKSETNNIITIDGTSSSGKTTVSKILAKRLNFKLLDSGKLYRSVGFIASKTSQSLHTIDNLGKLISDISLIANDNTHEFEIIYKNNKIDHLLYHEDVGEAASIVSKIPEVRKSMLDIQHACARGNNLIANGRDMGSEVFPNASLKLYINASLDVRAKRRFDELVHKGEKVKFDDVFESLKNRDESDMNRAISPLKIPHNAHIIDTSSLKPDAIVDKILNLYTITEN